MFCFRLYQLIPIVIYFCIYFYFIETKNQPNTGSIMIRDLKKFPATLPDYFVHFLMTNSQFPLEDAANFLDVLPVGIHSCLPWGSSTGFCPGVLTIGSISDPIQWISDMLENVFDFPSFKNMLSAVIAAKNFRLTRDRPNVPLAWYQGLSLAWAVVGDSRKCWRNCACIGCSYCPVNPSGS